MWLSNGYERRLAALARVFAKAVAKAMGELNRAQQQLGLAEIFQPGLLLTAEFRCEVRGKLERLDALLAEYRTLHDRYLLEFNAGVVKLLAEESADEQAQQTALAQSKIETHLQEQAQFYRLRRGWMDAVEQLLSIVEAHEQTISFDGEQLLFEADDVLETFQRTISEIDQLAEAEQVLYKQRLARMVRGSSVLAWFTQGQRS